MAKKSSKQKNKVPKEFSSSPFKNLKGLPAFKEQKVPVQKDRAEQEATPVSNDQLTFVDEMAFLGVKPLNGRVVKKLDSDKTNPPESPRLASEEHARAIFLEALGSVERTFKDEWTEDVPAKQAVPRRMRQVGRGQLKPEAELDLHGLTVEESSAQVRFFLQNASYQGFRVVLVITGKGLHSNDEPVLRRAMEKLLNELREQVLEWGVAPRRYGGDGALVVFLRV